MNPQKLDNLGPWRSLGRAEQCHVLHGIFIVRFFFSVPEQFNTWSETWFIVELYLYEKL